MSTRDHPTATGRRLVGRVAQLEQIDGVLDAMIRGSSEPTAVTGMLQTGRSTMLKALVEQAAERDLLTAIVGGDPTQSIRTVIANGIVRAIDSLAARRPGARGLGMMRGAVVDFRASTGSGLAITCYEMLHLVGRGTRDLGTGLIVGIDDVDAWSQPEVEAMMRAVVAAADRGGTALIVPSMLPNAALRADGQPLCVEIACPPLDADDIAELATDVGLALPGDVAALLALAVDGRPASAIATLSLLAGRPDAHLESVALAAAREVADRIDATWSAPVCSQLDQASMQLVVAVARLTDHAMPTLERVAAELGVSSTAPALVSTCESLCRRRLLCSPDGVHVGLSYELLRRYVLSL